MAHAKETRIIYKRIGTPGYTPDIDCYIKNGGYETLKKALKAGDPAALCSEVEKAGIKAGDKIAKEIVKQTGTMLGEAIADFIKFSSPEAIILFGGLTRSGKYILDPVKKAVDKNVMPIFKGKAQIVVSQLKDSDAAILGASALAWE